MIKPMPIPNPRFWKDRRVLITGHTGFKGAWLSFVLCQLGAKVCGFSLAPNTQPNLFTALNLSQQVEHHEGDLTLIDDVQELESVFQKFQPEFVFHLAAQALVRQSYDNPTYTFATNVMGTVQVLECIRKTPSVQTVLLVTTDKVYKNADDRGHRAFVETDELGGHDPYSASKAAMELVVASYRDAFFNKTSSPKLIIARAGNVIGGGDWAKDRLLPDAIRAWQKREVLQVRRPKAVRPWQHVLEPIVSYICSIEAVASNNVPPKAWNFGPREIATVEEVIRMAQKIMPYAQTHFSETIEGAHEAHFLMLNTDLAEKDLGITAQWNLVLAVNKTFEWYRSFDLGQSAYDLCCQDWQDYLTQLNQK